jgi:DmsE family decaheme c-type cytochrome
VQLRRTHARLAFLLTACLSIAVAAAAADPPKAADEKAQSPTAAGYIGKEACLTCHENADKGYAGTPHSRAADPRSPAAAQDCESCHGPGEAHSQDPEKVHPKTFKNVSAREANETCLSCHNRTAHADWEGSAHDARNVSCVSCHSVHAPKSAKAQLKTATQVETCAQCHKTQALKLQRAQHMPVREGKMECTSCHSPHGSNNVKMLKAGNSVNESCSSCHTEKRGPFLWEHAVGRENCTTCHDPHGSSNDRMLVAKEPMLCQRCHVHSRHPATVYDAVQVANKSNRVIGRACTNCHTAVHGSNHPSGAVFSR